MKKNYSWLLALLDLLWHTHRYKIISTTLRILTPQKWLFWKPRTPAKKRFIHPSIAGSNRWFLGSHLYHWHSSQNSSWGQTLEDGQAFGKNSLIDDRVMLPWGPSLKLTANLHLKIGLNAPKGKDGSSPNQLSVAKIFVLGRVGDWCLIENQKKKHLIQMLSNPKVFLKIKILQKP